MSKYTYDQLNGRRGNANVRCSCGGKYWDFLKCSDLHQGKPCDLSHAQLKCVDCGSRPPEPPEVSKGDVRSAFTEMRELMRLSSIALAKLPRNDDANLVDLPEDVVKNLDLMAHDVVGLAHVFFAYVMERGGTE